MTQELEVGAMAFYHEKGFVPAYQQAARFSGEGGHIGTMLDLVDARLGCCARGGRASRAPSR